MNKKGFSLVEVIVAVIILSIVGTALLKVSTVNKHLIELSNNLQEEITLFSIPITHHDKKYNQTQKSLYEYIESTYDINDDDIRQILNKIDVGYKQRNIFSEMKEGNVTHSILEEEILLSINKKTQRFINYEFQ